MNICRKCSESYAEYSQKDGQCKSCYNDYMRWYLNERFKKKIIEYKNYLGGKCSNCGNNESLHFDHIDREKKSFNITKGWAKKKSVIYNELDKCQLLCEQCHWEKTAIEHSLVMAGNKNPNWKNASENHGTVTCYAYGCRCEKCREVKKKSRKAL